MQQERRPTDLGAAPQRGATKLDVHPPPLPVMCVARVLYGGLLETSWASHGRYDEPIPGWARPAGYRTIGARGAAVREGRPRECTRRCDRAWSPLPGRTIRGGAIGWTRQSVAAAR